MADPWAEMRAKYPGEILVRVMVYGDAHAQAFVHVPHTAKSVLELGVYDGATIWPAELRDIDPAELQPLIAAADEAWTRGPL